MYISRFSSHQIISHRFTPAFTPAFISLLGSALIHAGVILVFIYYQSGNGKLVPDIQRKPIPVRVVVQEARALAEQVPHPVQAPAQTRSHPKQPIKAPSVAPSPAQVVEQEVEQVAGKESQPATAPPQSSRDAATSHDDAAEVVSSAVSENRQALDASDAVVADEAVAAANALEIYLGGLRRLIEQRKVYPTMSQRMGESGKVVVALELLRDGTIQDVKVKQGSQFSRLDQAALETVESVKQFAPMPEGIELQHLIIEVPIEFTL